MSHVTGEPTSLAYLSAERSAGCETAMERRGEGAEIGMLVIQAQCGDIRAFDVLFERYYSPICRYVSRMIGDDGIGCELTQDVFLKAWLSLPGLRSPGSFSSWLYRIATNHVNNYYKKHVRIQQEISLVTYQREGETLSVAGPEEQVELLELLKFALNRVSPTYRACLILAVLEELPYRQIAELLDMKETSVAKYVSRGLEQIRRIYYRFEEHDGAVNKERNEP